MGDATKIDVANKTFDQLYEGLQSQLEKKSGTTCYARFDAQKGLRIKNGIKNPLKFDSIMDRRGKKFSDAATIFKDAINLQYPDQRVGGKTLGEALVNSVMNDRSQGDRISAPEIKALYQKLHQYADEHNLEAAPSNQAAFSTVASSRIAQSNASIKVGEALLKDAVHHDVRKHKYYQDKPAAATARANEILSNVDLRHGLTTSSLNAVANEMANGLPSITGGVRTGNLLDLLDIRQRINTASHHIERLNQTLPKFAQHFSGEARLALEEAISERRAILRDLGNLSFPVDLNDQDKVGDLAARLEQNCFRVSDAMSEMNRSGFPNRKAASMHRAEHEIEVLGLAASLWNFAPGANGANSRTDLRDLLSKYPLEDSLYAMESASATIPTTLWNAPTRQASDTFKEVTEAYNKTLKESQMLWGDYEQRDPEATLGHVEQALTMALIQNDAMINSFWRAAAIRGLDQAFREEAAENSFKRTIIQRNHLNFQLAYVQALKQQGIQRAPSITPPPSNYAGSQSNAEEVFERANVASILNINADESLDPANAGDKTEVDVSNASNDIHNGDWLNTGLNQNASSHDEEDIGAE
ncbi:MAG: hypothetical protein AAGC95_01435 [Pseudomonadota bacterium]